MGQLSTGGWGLPQSDVFRNGGVGAFNIGQMGGIMGMNGMGQMNGRRPQTYQPPDQKRGICRDYHSKILLTFILVTLVNVFMQIMAIALVVLCASTVTATTLSFLLSFIQWTVVLRVLACILCQCFLGMQMGCRLCKALRMIPTKQGWTCGQ